MCQFKKEKKINVSKYDQVLKVTAFFLHTLNIKLSFYAIYLYTEKVGGERRKKFNDLDSMLEAR